MAVLFPRIVLCSVLIAADVSLAQSAPDAPLAELQVVPPGELFLSRTRREAAKPAALRVLAEAGGGVLMGAVMGLLGYAVGQSVIDDAQCEGEGCPFLGLVVGIPTAFLGIPGGVHGAGLAMGGRGGLGATFAGTVVGTGAGVLVALKSEDKRVRIASLIAGPLLGSIAGFEISHALHRPRRGASRAESASSPGLRVAPMAGVTPYGGLLGGLSGNF